MQPRYRHGLSPVSRLSGLWYSLRGGFHWHTFRLQISNPGWALGAIAFAESAIFVFWADSPSPFRSNFYFPEPRVGFGYVKPLWDTVESSLILLFPTPLTLLEELIYFFFYLHISQISVYYLWIIRILLLFFFFLTSTVFQMVNSVTSPFSSEMEDSH